MKYTHFFNALPFCWHYSSRLPDFCGTMKVFIKRWESLLLDYVIIFFIGTVFVELFSAEHVETLIFRNLFDFFETLANDTQRWLVQC